MGFMKRKNILKMIKNDDELALGLVASIPNPVIADIAGAAGYDWIRIEFEHVVYDLENIANFVRAADAAGIPVIVRMTVPELATPLLDMGVAGLMFPHVRSADQAKDLVDLVKYYPLGKRGMFGSGRAQRYGGMKIPDYIDEAREEIMLILQIEDNEGIENMEEIAAVKGYDFICTGRNDISQALGIPGQSSHPDVLDLDDRILELGIKDGKSYLFGAKDLEEASLYINDRSARLVTKGTDTTILAKGIKKMVDHVRSLTN